jgi:hypothetical protein
LKNSGQNYNYYEINQKESLPQHQQSFRIHLATPDFPSRMFAYFNSSSMKVDIPFGNCKLLTIFEDK